MNCTKPEFQVATLATYEDLSTASLPIMSFKYEISNCLAVLFFIILWLVIVSFNAINTISAVTLIYQPGLDY
jgi:hypothetical protein